MGYFEYSVYLFELGIVINKCANCSRITCEVWTYVCSTCIREKRVDYTIDSIDL